MPADPQRVSAAIIPWPVRARVKKPVLASTDAPPVERPAPTEPPKVDAPHTEPKPAPPATSTPASAPFSAAEFWGAKKKSGGGGSSGGGGGSDGGHKDGLFDQDDVAGAVIVLLILLLIGWMLFNLGGKPAGDDRLLEPQSALNAPAPQAPVVKSDPFPAGPIDLKPKSPMPEAAPVQAAPAPVTSEPVVTAQATPSPPTPAVQPAKATCAPGHMIHAYFCTSRSDLTPAARSALDAELEQWRSCAAGQELVVKGYADTRGSQALNLALGENRAKQLADILRAQGLNVSAVVGIGKLDGLDDGQNCLNQRRVDVGLKSEIDAATPSKACAPPKSVVPIVCEFAAPKPDAVDASPAR
ncbi:MAG: OmpA family protein [Alphaproteobacteria bacterium]